MVTTCTTIVMPTPLQSNSTPDNGHNDVYPTETTNNNNKITVQGNNHNKITVQGNNNNDEEDDNRRRRLLHTCSLLCQPPLPLLLASCCYCIANTWNFLAYHTIDSETIHNSEWLLGCDHVAYLDSRATVCSRRCCTRLKCDQRDTCGLFACSTCV
jgi:hypothetical protein